MKTASWLGFFSIVLIGTAAWFTQQPDSARASLPPAASPTVAIPSSVTPDPATPYFDAGFHEGEAGLSPSARAGREIWFKATAGNARFHTYTFQQRVTALIDWFGVLRGDRRDGIKGARLTLFSAAHITIPILPDQHPATWSRPGALAVGLSAWPLFSGR